MDCLINLIGITDGECSCWDADKPGTWSTINASETGLYITDPEYGYEPLDKAYANADCNDGNLWDVLIKARASAVNNFSIDLGAQIQSLYTNRAQFKGTIGRPVASRADSSAQDYAGIILFPRLLNGAKFVVTHIHLGLSYSGDVDVIFTSNNGSYFTPVTTTITAVANTWVRHALASNIEVPFFSPYREGDLRYYVYFDTSGGTILPLSNNFACCSGKAKHENFLKAGGFQLETLTNLADTVAKSSSANGLSLEGYLYCSGLDWLCQLDEVGGYSLKMVVARAIQMKAAALLYAMDQDSTRINRFTEPSKANIERRGQLNELYFNQVQWIANNLPIDAVDCLLCNDKARGRFQKKALIS